MYKGIHEDSSTTLTPQSRKKTIFRGALKISVNIRRGVIGLFISMVSVMTIADDEGQSIYLLGRLADGQAVKASINGLETSDALPCVDCHRLSGLGSSESGNTFPPVSWSILSTDQTDAGTARFSQIRPPNSQYDLHSLHRVLTEGIKANGEKLNSIMPRYALTKQQTSNLQQYLKTLYSKKDPGVTNQNIFIATIVDSRLPQQQQQQHLQFLRGLVAMKNAKTRGELKRKKYAPIQKLPQYQAYKKWQLLAWKLPEDSAQWSATLNEKYQETPVFAVLSPLIKNNYETIASFCSEQKLPCLFAQNSGGFSGDYYNYVFRNEEIQRKESIQKLKRNSKKAVYFVAENGEITALENNRQSIPKLDSSTAAALLKRFNSICSQKAILLLRSSLDLLQPLLKEQCPLQQQLQIKLFRDGGDDFNTYARLNKKILNKKICWLTDYSRVMHKNFRQVRVDALARKFKLPSRHTSENLANSLFAFGLLSDSLHKLNGYFSRDYLLEVMEHMLNSYPNYTYYDKLSGAPGQRYIVGVLQEYCPAGDSKT